MASTVCAIESMRSLRCVVRNRWRVSSSSNCSMAIMLTGPRRSIFSLSARRWLLRRSSTLGIRDSGFGIPAESRLPIRRRPEPRLVTVWVGLLGRDGGGVGRGSRRALHLLDVREHLVERHLHGIGARLGQMSQVAFCRRARDFELAGLGCERLRARVEPPEWCASCASTRGAQRAVAASSAARTSSRSASSAQDVLVERRVRSSQSTASSSSRRALGLLGAPAIARAIRSSSSRAALSQPQHIGGKRRRRARPGPRARRARLGRCRSVATAASLAPTAAAAAHRPAARRLRAAPLRAGRSPAAPLRCARRARHAPPRPAAARGAITSALRPSRARPRRARASCAS